MLLEYGIINYNGRKWTTNADILFKLYELGMANRSITPFTLQDDKKTLITDISKIKPTISPKDPNFQSWWTQHKSEWETPKKDGQEPFDD